MSQEYKFHAQGMHCNACEVLIEDALKELPGVQSVNAKLATREVTVIGNFSEDVNALAEKFSAPIKEHGYSLSPEKISHDKKWGDFLYAIPIAALFIVAFFILQKSGVLDLTTNSDTKYGTALTVGLIASVSTCLAVVGGLVLSLSANCAKTGDTWKPQVLFHVGRLAGFFVLGGVIGAIGSAFQLGITGNLVLGLIVAAIMLILGINLLDVFHLTKKFQLTMPKFFAQKTLAASKANHWVMPLLIGIATFFLPCGFTQSMQVFTLTTRSFLAGGTTMLVFALGTLPVLALLSFGSFSIAHKPWKGVFFKTAGIIVIALALFNLLNALAVAGIIQPIFNF